MAKLVQASGKACIGKWQKEHRQMAKHVQAGGNENNLQAQLVYRQVTNVYIPNNIFMYTLETHSTF